MSSRTFTLTGRPLPVYTRALAWIFVAACIAMALYVPLFDGANWEPLGSALYLVAGLLVAGGTLAYGRTSPWLAFALVTVGALLGGVTLVWTLFAPLLALVLIALFAWGALRGARPFAVRRC